MDNLEISKYGMTKQLILDGEEFELIDEAIDIDPAKVKKKDFEKGKFVRFEIANELLVAYGKDVKNALILIDGLNEEIEQLREANNMLMNELETRLESGEMTVSNMQKDFEEFDKRLRSQQEALRRAGAENQLLSEKAAQADELREEVVTLKERVQELESEVDLSAETVIKRDKVIAEQEERIDQLTHDIANFNDEKEDLRQQVNGLIDDVRKKGLEYGITL